MTVHFTGTTVNPETSGSAASATYNEPVTYRKTLGFSANADPQTVSVPSRTAPWLDGFLPATLSPGVCWSGLLVQGTYSVVDANGVTLESDTIITGPGPSQSALAKRIAERVAAVAR